MVHRVQDQSGDTAVNPVSRLQQQWARGSFVLTVQLPPLLTASAQGIIEQVATYVTNFDAVLAPDAPGGVVALSSQAMAALLRRAGVEAVVRMSGRDRNRPTFYLGALIALEERLPVEELSVAQFLVTMPLTADSS